MAAKRNENRELHNAHFRALTVLNRNEREVVQKLHNGNLIDGNDALTTAYDRTHREGIFLGRR